MKRSELRQIIREEINRLNEANKDSILSTGSIVMFTDLPRATVPAGIKTNKTYRVEATGDNKVFFYNVLGNKRIAGMMRHVAEELVQSGVIVAAPR